MKKVLVVLVTCAAVSACGGDDKASAPTTVVATAVPATVPPATVNPLQRRAAVNEYVTAVAFEGTCYSLGCIDPANVVVRFQKIRDLAVAIPGDDVAPFAGDIAGKWMALSTCVRSAGFLQCSAEDSAFEASFRKLYDALR